MSVTFDTKKLISNIFDGNFYKHLTSYSEGNFLNVK